jgi:hypothetical protein
MDVQITDVIQNEVLGQAATRLQLDTDEYVRLQAIAGATAQLALGFEQVVALEQDHIDAGDYTACGYEWDSGVKDPHTRQPITVTCRRIAEHPTVAVAGRESHAGYLPSGSLITVDTSNFTPANGDAPQ